MNFGPMTRYKAGKMAPSCRYENLPEAIRQAFAEQALLPSPRIAKLLGMDLKTLRKHRENGDITARIKGTGRVHRHWVYSIDDVARFLAPKTASGVDSNRQAQAIPRFSYRAPRSPTVNVKLVRRKRTKIRRDGDESHPEPQTTKIANGPADAAVTGK